MKKELLIFTVKVLIVAAIFYCVCPKYQLGKIPALDSDLWGDVNVRINMVSGEVEVLVVPDPNENRIEWRNVRRYWE